MSTRYGSLDPAAPLISVVIPSYNEGHNVAAVYEGVRSALRGRETFEIIFVDDGSTDETAARVRRLRARDPSVRLLRFGRNFGQQAALAAGLQAARGAAVITLDCDLQHPPGFLPRMIEAWRAGGKVVLMVRMGTQGVGPLKSATSRLFYRVLNLISEIPVVSGAADYQLLDRAVVDAVAQFKDRYPFLRGRVAWLGFPTTRLEYIAPERNAGISGYSMRKMLQLAVQAMTGLSSKPLRLSFYLGILAATLSLMYAVFALVALMAGRTVQGWTSVIITVAFLGAVQLVSVGILGEYIARIYDQTRGIPPFVIVEDEACIPEEQPYRAVE